MCYNFTKFMSTNSKPKRVNRSNTIKLFLIVFFFLIALPYITPNFISPESWAIKIVSYIFGSSSVIYPSDVMRLTGYIAGVLFLFLCMSILEKIKYKKLLICITTGLFLLTTYMLVFLSAKVYDSYIRIPFGFVISKEYNIKDIQISIFENSVRCGSIPQMKKGPSSNSITCTIRTYGAYAQGKLLFTKSYKYPAGNDYSHYARFVDDQFQDLINLGAKRN